MEAEAAERRRWEEERKRQEEKEKRDRDHNRWRRFIQFAKLWEEARLAGSFLDALEKHSLEPETTYGEKTSLEWLKWARERQHAFDPSRWHIAGVWRDLASITAWESSKPLLATYLEKERGVLLS